MKTLDQHPLLMQAYELSVAVEKLPAHSEQTDLISKLGAWRDDLYAHLERHGLLEQACAVKPKNRRVSKKSEERMKETTKQAAASLRRLARK